jgi:cyclase
MAGPNTRVITGHGLSVVGKPTAALDAKWGQEAGWTAVDFVPVVYYELGGAGRLEER